MPPSAPLMAVAYLSLPLPLATAVGTGVVGAPGATVPPVPTCGLGGCRACNSYGLVTWATSVPPYLADRCAAYFAAGRSHSLTKATAASRAVGAARTCFHAAASGPWFSC